MRGWFVVFACGLCCWFDENWPPKTSVSPATESVVPGREGYTLLSDSRSGVIFLLWTFGRGEGGSWPSLSWPKTKPVAAAATAVPVPMSYRRCRLASMVPQLERRSPSASLVYRNS